MEEQSSSCAEAIGGAGAGGGSYGGRGGGFWKQAVLDLQSSRSFSELSDFPTAS